MDEQEERVDGSAVDVNIMAFVHSRLLMKMIAGVATGLRFGCIRTRGVSIIPAGFVLIASLPQVGCGSTSQEEIRITGGDYGPVTHDMIAGATFTSRTGKDQSYDDLQWTFQQETFLIIAGNNGLPPDIAERLLPEGVKATELSGKWTVADDVITFTEIVANN